MAFLELAEDRFSMLAQDPKENYIFIPAGYAGATKDMHVREDFFDGLPDSQFIAMMQDLAPFQTNTGLSALPIALAAGKIAANFFRKRQERVAAGTAKPLIKPGGLISKIGAAVKGRIAGMAPAQSEAVIMERNLPVSGGVNVGGTQIDFDNAPEQTFFQKYKTPLIIGGVVLLAGGVYLATRKK
jgi:hypothetical protein